METSKLLMVVTDARQRQSHVGADSRIGCPAEFLQFRDKWLGAFSLSCVWGRRLLVKALLSLSLCGQLKGHGARRALIFRGNFSHPEPQQLLPRSPRAKTSPLLRAE